MSDIESKLISSLVISPNLWEKIEDITKPEHFEKLGKAFGLIHSQLTSGDDINIPLFINELQKQRISWRPIPNVDKKWIVDYAKALHENYLQKDLNQFSFDISTMGDRPSDKKIAFIREYLAKIEDQSAGGGDTRHETYEKSLKYLDEHGSKLLKSPWPTFNEKHGGFLKNDIALIGALPGTGKTTIMRQLALHFASNGHATVIFTLETNKEKINTYIACTALNIKATRVFKNLLDPEEKKLIKAKLEEIKSWPIYIYDVSDCRSDAEKISLMILRAVRRYKAEAIFIDYAQIMEYQNLEETPKLKKIVPLLKRTMIMADAALILFSQFRGEVTNRKDPKPKKGDYRGASDLLDAGDMSMYMYRPEIHDIPNKDSYKGQLIIGFFKNKYMECLDEVVVDYHNQSGTYKDNGGEVPEIEIEDNNFFGSDF
jgi:replicative DNA helicase